VETIWLGANYLLGSDVEKIVKTAKKIIENEEELCKKLGELPNPFGDGRARSQSFLR
jgi:UDP-N-acetylglucosamine 2-epimerase